MAYFTVGSLINCGTNASTWRVTAINRDGTLEAVWISGRHEPAETVKTIQRPEKYRLVAARAANGPDCV